MTSLADLMTSLNTDQLKTQEISHSNSITIVIIIVTATRTAIRTTIRTVIRTATVIRNKTVAASDITS
jgi:hypothetical protein